MSDFKMLGLTDRGMKKVEQYRKELLAKQKELLDAKKDTIDVTELPGVGDIVNDIESFEREDVYANNWGVTDHYDADHPLVLTRGKDYEDRDLSDITKDLVNINVLQKDSTVFLKQPYFRWDAGTLLSTIRDDLNEEFVRSMVSGEKEEQR